MLEMKEDLFSLFKMDNRIVITSTGTRVDHNMVMDMSMTRQTKTSLGSRRVALFPVLTEPTKALLEKE